LLYLIILLIILLIIATPIFLQVRATPGCAAAEVEVIQQVLKY